MTLKFVLLIACHSLCAAMALRSQNAAAETALADRTQQIAAAAQSLVRPASAARALNNGALYIERPDLLVQLIAKQKGLSHPVIDGIVTLVNSRLEANRKKAASA